MIHRCRLLPGLLVLGFWARPCQARPYLRATLPVPGCWILGPGQAWPGQALPNFRTRLLMRGLAGLALLAGAGLVDLCIGPVPGL